MQKQISNFSGLVHTLFTLLQLLCSAFCFIFLNIFILQNLIGNIVTGLQVFHKQRNKNLKHSEGVSVCYKKLDKTYVSISLSLKRLQKKIIVWMASEKWGQSFPFLIISKLYWYLISLSKLIVMLSITTIFHFDPGK